MENIRHPYMMTETNSEFLLATNCIPRMPSNQQSCFMPLICKSNLRHIASLDQTFSLLAPMLALRCLRQRFWLKTPSLTAMIHFRIRSEVSARFTNGLQRVLCMRPSQFVRNSSSSTSAAKITVEQSRHAEISAYVERLHAQDVQVITFCFTPLLQNLITF